MVSVTYVVLLAFQVLLMVLVSIGGNWWVLVGYVDLVSPFCRFSGSGVL